MVDALVKVGQRLGVEYRLSTGVSSISLSADGRRATGVKLADGQELSADVVVCNADLVYAYNSLLPQTAYAKSLARREASCSSISFYWAIDRKMEALKAHNIFLAEDYRESFDSIFKKHLIPTEPSFYVNVPSRVDPSAAPEGTDAVVVLVPVGHLLSSSSGKHRGTTLPREKEGLDRDADASTQDWEAMVALARSTVLRTVKARTGADLGPHIVHEEVNTPASWLDRFNLDRGAILGLSHSFFNVLSFRPKTKHPSIEGLFFAGASTHPGTGVPICLAGSKLVAEQILREHGAAVPWPSNEGVGDLFTGRGQGAKKAIDRVQPPSLLLRSPMLMLLLVLSMLVLVGMRWGVDAGLPLPWSAKASRSPPRTGGNSSPLHRDW